MKHPFNDKLHPIYVVAMEKFPRQIQIKVVDPGPITWLPVEDFDYDLMKDSHFEFDLAYVKVSHVKMIIKNRF